MDGRTAPSVGASDPHARAAREALLSALIYERFHAPLTWWHPPGHDATIAQRRRILLGKEEHDG